MQNYEKVLKAKIIGYETQITMILDKWNVSINDQNKIINLLAKIEADTAQCTREHDSNQAYYNKYNIKYKRAK